MIQIAEMWGADWDKMVEFVFMGLQIFEAGSGDYSSQWVADKIDLELFEVGRRVDKVFNFDG